MKTLNFWMIFFIILFGTAFVGWVKNIIWVFSQHDLVHVALGIIGIFFPPIGAVHGWVV